MTIPARSAPKDSVVVGVCGGLAIHYERDATLIRLAFIVFFVISGGAALFVYFALAIFMKIPYPVIEKKEKEEKEENANVCPCKAKEEKRDK